MNPSSFRSALTQLSVALFIATAAVHPTYSFAEDVPQDAQTNASAGGTVVETALTEAALERESAVPASVWDRIRGGFGIPELNSPLVDRWTTYYAKDPEYVQRMAMRASQYLYNIVEEVESRGLPMELALLPFVESAFQPEALSRAKASGLWQFMPATGADYALEQNLWRDDRIDVVERTRAALD